MVGPSGVGKNSLVKEILKKYEGIFEKKVSHTTRPSKKIEKAAQNYYIITKEEFQKKIDRGDFVEYKEVGGHLYGTCK